MVLEMATCAIEPQSYYSAVPGDIEHAARRGRSALAQPQTIEVAPPTGPAPVVHRIMRHSGRHPSVDQASCISPLATEAGPVGSIV